MVPAITFHVTQIEKTEAKTPITVDVSQSKEKLRNKAIFIRQLALVAITAFTHAEGLASLTDVESML